MNTPKQSLKPQPARCFPIHPLSREIAGKAAFSFFHQHPLPALVWLSEECIKLVGSSEWLSPGPISGSLGAADPAPPANALWLIPAGREERGGGGRGRYLGPGVMSAPSSVSARIPDMV